jgi:transcriptional regulator with XRE-family HTH domain
MRYSYVMVTADELRAWRGRRRLSQLELALRAGTTQRHVSFIESGRSVPGRGMILRLAEAMEVPLRDRNALLTAAGYAPAYSHAAFDDEANAPVRAALEQILAGHGDSPAVLADGANGILSTNAAFDRLAATADPALRAPGATVARLFLDARGLAPRIRNLEVWGWHVIDGLRRYAEREQRPQLAALAGDLEADLPPREREAAPIGTTVPLVLAIADGTGELALLTTLTHFGTTVDVTVAELTLEAFLPADAATARALRRAR